MSSTRNIRTAFIRSLKTTYATVLTTVFTSMSTTNRDPGKIIHQLNKLLSDYKDLYLEAMARFMPMGKNISLMMFILDAVENCGYAVVLNSQTVGDLRILSCDYEHNVITTVHPFAFTPLLAPMISDGTDLSIIPNIVSYRHSFATDPIDELMLKYFEVASSKFKTETEDSIYIQFLNMVGNIIEAQLELEKLPKGVVRGTPPSQDSDEVRLHGTKSASERTQG